MYSVITALVFTLLACATSKPALNVAPADYGISYTIPLNDAARANLPALSAVVAYDGNNAAQCDISFRLFVAPDATPVDFTLKSRHYVASYTIGGSCQEVFRIPLRNQAAFLAEQSPKALRFVIIPIDMDGNRVTTDLRRNFALHLE